MTRVNKALFLLTLIIVLTASAVSADKIAGSSSVRQDSAAVLSAENVAADSSGGHDSTALLTENGSAADSSAAQDSAAVLTDGNMRPDSSIHHDTIAQSPQKIDKPETSDKKLEISPPDAKPKTRPDTSSKISGTYWGFGIGLSLSSIPVFGQWRNALPDSMHKLGVTAAFGNNPAAGDTLRLRYSVSEPPDQFNFTLPFCISLYTIKEKSVTAFSLSFYHSSKQFQSIFQFSGDSLGRRVSLYESLDYYSLAIEGTYMREIPAVFFSVDGAQRAYLSMSLSASPVNTFTRDHGIKLEAPQGDLRMQALADSVSKKLAPKLTANGMSLSWRLGICAIRNMEHGGGLEIGLYYSGSYASSFQSEGEQVKTSQIDPKDKDAGKPLSFLSNGIQFKVTFLMASNREKLTTQ